MDRDYLNVPTQYYIVVIWNGASLFSAVFGLIQICHRARDRDAGGLVYFVYSTRLDGFATVGTVCSAMQPDN
jgi:hypothetical protein